MPLPSKALWVWQDALPPYNMLWPWTHSVNRCVPILYCGRRSRQAVLLAY